MRAPSRYLVPDESMLFASRRHSVVLAPGILLLALCIAGAVALWVEAPRLPTDHLRELAPLLVAVGILYLLVLVWRWSLSRYVITNMRVILIEGLVARRIKSLPLRLVIDTTYHRTVAGRIFGYCDIEVNLSGHPGLRRLSRVPHANEVYSLILRLLSQNEGGGGAPGTPPQADARFESTILPSAEK